MKQACFASHLLPFCLDDVRVFLCSIRGDMLSSKARFEFDACFKPESQQVEVYEHVKPFVTSFLDGYNVCIFAYGQTGSGKVYYLHRSLLLTIAPSEAISKSHLIMHISCLFDNCVKTFTMEGPPDNRGVNLRSISNLFELSAERSTEMIYEFTVSYLEIYNEVMLLS
jgi:kinesin family member C2/C3